MNEYFEILGLDETASLEEIEAAYVRCLKLYHPDTYVGDKSDAERITREVIFAYRAIISKTPREEAALQSKDKSAGAHTRPKSEKNKSRKGTVYLVAIALLMGLLGSIIRLQGYSVPTEKSLSKSNIFSEKIMLEGISASKQIAIKDHPEWYSIEGKNDTRWRLELNPRADGPKTWAHVFGLKNETISSAVACLNPIDDLPLTVSASLLIMRVGDSAEKLENGCFRLLPNSEANILIETDKNISSFALEIGQNRVPTNKFLPLLRNQFYVLVAENVTTVPMQSERLQVDEPILVKNGLVEEKPFGDPIVRPIRPKEQTAETKPKESAEKLLLRTSRPAAPVAHRAALLLDAPDDPSRVKTYVGNVVWRLENVNRGLGQPLTVGVRAEIDWPDAKLKAIMLIQKNTDDTLPASHTIELRFMPAEGGVVPGISQIQTPQLRREDTSSGDSLVGVPAPILRNYFLVGLTRGGTTESRNVDLMRNRGWFDVPILLTDKRVAKITFEKGVTGENVLNEALTGWSSKTRASQQPVAKPLLAEPKKVPSVEVRPDNTIIDPNAPAPSFTAADGATASNPDELKNKGNSSEIARLLSLELGKQRSASNLTVDGKSSLGASDPDTPRMSPSLWKELDTILHEQYKNCWAYKGAGSAQRYVPIIKVEYSKDGSLIGHPSLLNPPPDPSLIALAESAVRAVRRCNPIKIPKKFFPFYGQWKARILRFDLQTTQ